MEGGLGCLGQQLRQRCEAREKLIGRILGLPLAEFRVIHSVSGQRRPLVKQLAASLQVSSSAVTQIVGTLESKGLASRLRDERDRRTIRVVLTEAGETVLKRIVEVQEQVHQEIFSSIPQDLHKQAIESIQAFIAAIDRWLISKNETPPPGGTGPCADL